MNGDLVKISKQQFDYDYPHGLLIKDFKRFAGEEIIRCEVVDLTVKLKLYPNIAWRRIITPVDITFKQLHEILQVAFNWENCHLYKFNIFDEAGKCVLKVISEYEEVYESLEECQIRLDSEVNLLRIH